MNDGFALEQQNLVEIHINNNAGYHSTRTYLAAKKDKNSGLKMDCTLTFNLLYRNKLIVLTMHRVVTMVADKLKRMWL